MNRCPISDLAFDQCHDCIHHLHGKRTPTDVLALMTLDDNVLPGLARTDPSVGPPIGTTTTAKYSGYCRECENDIREGEGIKRNLDGYWVHTTHDPSGSIEAV